MLSDNLESARIRDIIHDSIKPQARGSLPEGDRPMKRARLRSGFVCALLLCCCLAGRAQDAAKHAITFEDMMHMHRVSEAQVSPDGKWVAYTVATPDMEANRNASNLWVVPTSGGEAHPTERRSRFSHRGAELLRCTCCRWRVARHRNLRIFRPARTW